MTSECCAPARAAATATGGRGPSTTCSWIWAGTASCQGTRCGCTTARAPTPSLPSRPTTTPKRMAIWPGRRMAPAVASKCRSRRRGLTSGKFPCLRRMQEASYLKRIKLSGATKNTCGNKRKSSSNRVHQTQKGCAPLVRPLPSLLKMKDAMSASRSLNLKIQQRQQLMAL